MTQIMTRIKDKDNHECRNNMELVAAYKTATRVGDMRADPRMQTFIYECVICGQRRYEDKIVADLSN